MGCDIHANIERIFNGDWDKDYPFSVAQNIEIERWYELFGYLAGVRDGSVKPIVEPRGLPTNISCETKEFYEEWEDDAHNVSWLTFEELTKLPKKFKSEPFYVYMKALAKEHGDKNVRMVFWFDN